ncbi:CTP synthase ura7 [Coemansia sp. RSA 2706]|nr:CTP synthase ura7 [Coemansia sp. RSA 2706]KAJ2307393.1 CTP synthase ura7 [Coemansia sp. RSA 2705]KAJ2726490.1 CTP synthase ura7 [Coemansia sp. Cherry 401B]
MGKQTKYIVVSGGVISGIGKGIIASSTGLLLKTLGLTVTSIKIDPYLNIDAGTLSPLDHGEVFVLDDGGEVDLDLGNYERYLNVTLTRDNNITTGKIYREVIDKERRGDYLGKTVQVVPHITNAIQDWVERVSRTPVSDTGRVPDVCIIELGGTVGDIESAPFIEAMRQFQFRVGHDNFCLIHVSLVPVVGAVGEQKTKPTQASVRDLRGLGLSPDILACRSAQPFEDGIREKLSMFCQVTPQQVFSVHDCESLYHVPVLLRQQGLIDVLAKRLELGQLDIPSEIAHEGEQLWAQWREFARRRARDLDVVTIAVVGKYTYLADSYISVVKALEHAALNVNRQVKLSWVEASDLEETTMHKDPLKYHEAWQRLCAAHGILVPGGFGERGVEGKVLAAKWAREHAVPYLGICLGLQVAVIEFARNVCGMRGAHSAEFREACETPAVVFMPEIDRSTMGGTMRLGSRPTKFQDTEFARTCMIKQLYGGEDEVHERHRHRYEVNPEIVAELESKGLHFVGRDAETGERMEILELADHPYFVAAQYHPEYLTRPLNPSPPFLGLLLAASGQLDAYLAGQDLAAESETKLKIKTCGKCRGRRYCSRSHQIADWNAGHRTQCCGDAAPAAPETAEHARRLQRMLFPEHIIVSEEEEEEGEGGSAGQDSDDDGDDDDDAGSQNGTALVPAAGERAEDSEIEVDAEFMQFQRRIQRNPDQVLRYARAPGQIASEAPLFVSASDQPDQGSDVPHCPGCGEPREFEFQVMPQLLNHLALDAADPRSIDWGTLLVYSCPRSCPPRDSEYAEETVCRQNFSAHGIGQKYMRAYYGDQTAFASQFDSLNM